MVKTQSFGGDEMKANKVVCRICQGVFETESSLIKVCLPCSNKERENGKRGKSLITGTGKLETGQWQKNKK